MIFETGLLGQVVIDRNQVILDVDDRFLAIVERDRSDLIGAQALSFTFDADRQHNQPMLDRLLDRGPAFTITKRYIRGDGSLVWVENHVSLTRERGDRMVACATCRSIVRPFGVAPLDRHHAVIRQLSQAILAGKRLFGNEIVSAPATEMLVWLYRAELEGKSLTIDELAERLGLPGVVVRRWAKLLEERRLLEQETGSRSPRSVVRIAQTAERLIDGLLSDLNRR